MASKNTPGYISRYRKVNLIWLLVWVIIGVAIFTTGVLIWHTRANILTVLAVLMVLPGAKRIVALIALGKKKSVSAERCKNVEEAADPFIYGGTLDTHEYEPIEDEDEEQEVESDHEGQEDSEDQDEPEEDLSTEREYESYGEKEIPWNVIFTDYVFTSTEKIMMLDFLVVTDGTVFVLPASTNQDQEYVKKYLTEGITRWSPAFDIRFVWDDEKLLSGLKSPAEKKVPLRDRREVIAYLQSLAM